MEINPFSLFLFLWKRKRPTKKVIIVGIGYPSFSIAQALLNDKQNSKLQIEIVAFIDDEPWNNRTLVLGTTVYSPSDMSALIKKHDVDLVISFEGEPPFIPANIWKDTFRTKAEIINITSEKNLTVEQQLTTIYNKLSVS